MKRVSIIAAVGVLALSACSGVDQERSDSPTGPVVFKPGPPSDECSFRDARGYVGDYFKLSADRKTANDYLKAAEALPLGFDRNTQLFNLFQFISLKRAVSPSDVNAPEFAAKLVLEARDCGSLVISHDDTFIESVLTEAIRNDPGPPEGPPRVGGAFAYREGACSATMTFACGYVATVDGGSALWTEDWTIWIGGRSVAFGAKSGEDVDFGNEAPVGSFSYRWGLIYDATSTGPRGNGNDDIAVVGLCEPGVDYLADPRYRVGRVRGDLTKSKTVLQLAEIPGFCVDPPQPQYPGGIVSRVLRGVIGFFTPTPLQARRRAPPGMSGGLDDLSDILGVNAVSIDVDTVEAVASGPVTAPFLVQIHAATAAGNDFENVGIKLEISGNQGIPAGATLHRADGCVGIPATNPDTLDLDEVTNELGIAAFCVRVNKSGGYALRAFHLLTPAFAADTVITNTFNRTPGQ